MYKAGPYLSQVDFPSDLREKFELHQLPQVAEELRQYLIDVISEIGNSHFSASLGVVELSIALHYVFNTPKDQLIWDVGHQAYGHKILTGRRTVFHTNRLKDGISGFPKRSESEYDAFGVGHSSTSISAAIGMAIANQYLGNTDIHHVAVIGDGALTAGLAFEGLNHAGSVKDVNLLVILNDNCMAIDPNVGALKDNLTGISSQTFKQNNLFESLNFNYFGPVDGHDVIELSKKLEELKQVKGPKILHCLTRKGAGYKFAEEGNPTKWHAPGIFNKTTGEIAQNTSENQLAPKYQDVFGRTIVELAKQNKKIMGITPAMPTGSSLNFMMEEMPNRAFDVGIAEQHAVTFAAGLATQGLIPFCNIYSTFMQRAYDQVLHDVALQDLPVVFCLDRGGLVGADGATHHGAYDYAYMRHIPNMIVSAPMNEQELRNLMYTAQFQKNGPFSIRYPRGNGVMKNWKTPFETIKVGSARKLSEGRDLAILSIGHPGNFVQQALNKIENKPYSITHYDMRFVKPIDEAVLHEVFSKFDNIITVEDACLMGGFGSAVVEFMVDNNYHAHVKRLGIPDHFIHHGTQEELQIECGFDAVGILNAIYEVLE